MHRREFLSTAGRSAAGAALATTILASAGRARSLANDRVTVCVAGVRGRGGALLATFAGLPDVDVKYVCDIDPSVLESRLASVADTTGRRPEGIKDFRAALDDGAVDALVLGTPDHWHAIPTIMACQAGKDVYVEKPDGHNLIEGRTMVAALRKHGRVVQMGTQARSGPHIHSAMEYLRSGGIGRATFAKAWESSRQGSLGLPADGTPPDGVDYDLWLGPAPSRPFNPVRFHGNWRWFFDYGTGDLGNDGVHRLDLARWALETAVLAQGGEPLGLPRSVSATGGKLYFDDCQEWPDTLIASYDYAGTKPASGAVLTYEMRVWSPYPMEGESEGAAVFGDAGYVVIGNSRWRAFDARGDLIREESGTYNDAGHAQNFIDCMRTREKPTADLETVGHPSSVLCHLGNAAWRAGRSLRFDAATYTFPGDDDANQYLTRPEYRAPWTLPRLEEV